MGPERFFFFFFSDRGNELWPCEQMWLIQVQTQHTGTHTQTQWVNRIWGSTWWTSSVFPPPRLVCRRRCLPTSQTFLIYDRLILTGLLSHALLRAPFVCVVRASDYATQRWPLHMWGTACDSIYPKADAADSMLRSASANASSLRHTLQKPTGCSFDRQTRTKCCWEIYLL